MPSKVFIIKIDGPRTYELAKALDPLYKDVLYEEAKNCFIGLNYPTEGTHTVIRPEDLRGSTLETLKIRAYDLVRD